MSLRRLLLLMSTLGLLVCLVAAPVLASEEGGANPVFSTTGLVFRILNFLIIAYGAWYVFAKKLPGAFHARAEGIAASISDAARAKQEAERHLREAE